MKLLDINKKLIFFLKFRRLEIKEMDYQFYWTMNFGL